MERKYRKEGRPLERVHRKQTHRPWKQVYGYQKERVGGRGFRVWDWHKHTVACGMEGQQEAAVQHWELCSIFCDNPYGRRIFEKEWVRIYVCNRITAQQKLTQHCKSTTLQ